MALGVSKLRIMQMQWVFLAVAIVSEVIGTSALKASEGFSRLWPTAIVVVGYASAFYFLSLTLKTIPVGVAYAIWSGAGVALIGLIAWVLYGQSLDLPAIIGMSLIVAGVVILNLFSNSITHS
jgi:small multidrug resistance pump